jgi:hypothetical protein
MSNAAPQHFGRRIRPAVLVKPKVDDLSTLVYESLYESICDAGLACPWKAIYPQE